MCSKISLLAFALAIVSLVDASPYTTTQSPQTTTKTFQDMYHICPRSMVSWQFLFNNGPAVRCASGPTGNKCRGSSCGEGLVCCQGEDGCNQCVTPCPVNPDLPDCGTRGVYAFDSPVGCVQHACKSMLNTSKLVKGCFGPMCNRGK